VLDPDYAKLILDVIPPIMRYMKNEMRKTARPELTVPQFRILARLSLSIATNRELAEWMGVSPPTMTRMVDSLLKKKLLKKLVNSSDRRQIKLSLSDKGLQVFNQIFSELHLKITKHVALLDSVKKIKLANGLTILREMFL